MKAYNYERLKPYKFYDFVMPIVRFLLRILTKTRVVGIENLPADAAGHVLVCNHISLTDPVFLAALSRRKWRFMAKQELFENGFMGWLMTHSNAFPVNREGTDRKSIDYAVSILKDGNYGLGIFPEGTRSEDGKPGEAKPGAALMARQTKANVIPACIYREGKFKLFGHTTVRFGEVIPYADLGMGEVAKSKETRAAAAIIWDRVVQLWAEGY
ncbi:MAG: 1-acyl-sn-glycerol-3-phosphate acyltransferase [Oscillospiraceae bacterium]|jgi:1-acyl-sn-glycerol-3-phosphate acyltransferase|nr:1-acyl-sn-glycerol-3-phosphate acyltransferase [Oscillospiraceae bacterium]